MSAVETLRLLERVHGHLGWLAAIALVHPAWLLRDPRRRARLSVALAAATVTLSGLFGAWIYPQYSRGLRRSIYVASQAHGLLFERKEHLAVVVIALAWAGCALHLSRGKDETSAHRARAAHYAFVASAILAVAVATMGTLAASFRSF